MPGEQDFDMSAAVDLVSEGLGFGGDGADSGDDGNSPPDPPEKQPQTPPEHDGSRTGDGDGDGAPAEGSAEGQQPSPVEGAPPKTWRKEALAGWATLPPEVKAEVLKREEDMHRGLEGYRADAEVGKTIKSVLAPYEAVFRHHGVDQAGQMQVLSGLTEAHVRLTTGQPDEKIGIVEHLIQSYGIPLPKLLARLTGGTYDESSAPFVDPAVASLRDELGQVKMQLTRQQQVEQTQRAAEVKRNVDTFAADPKNVHFQDVADDMARLLSSKVVGTLQEAYDKAIWTNPVTRAKELARIQADADAKRSKDAAEAAAKAKKATAANVRTATRTGGATASSKGSIDDTLEETLAAIQSRS